MNFFKKSEKEFLKLSSFDSFRKDMNKIRSQRHNPFFKNGKVDVDAYIDFVTQYNEFINHSPKPFKPIKDDDLRF